MIIQFKRKMENNNSAAGWLKKNHLQDQKAKEVGSCSRYMLGIHRPAISLSQGGTLEVCMGAAMLSVCLKHIGILSDFDLDLALHFYKKVLHMEYEHQKDTRSGVVLPLCLTLNLLTSDLSITLTVGCL